MYAGYGASPPLTNNPFIPDAGQQASARFPDISTPPQPQQQQYDQWNSNGSMMGGGGGYFPQQQGGYQQQQSYPQQQQMGYVQQPQQQQMTAGYISPGPQSYSTPTQGQMTGGFQPSSSFGQQLAAHVSGSSYGYLQGQQQQQPQNTTAYNPVQQQLQNNPGYIAQFDPYSSIGQGWDGANSNNNNMSNQGGGGGMPPGMAQGYGNTSSMGGSNMSGAGVSYGTSILGEAHPKDYIRTHRLEIEAWDQQAWKQLLGTFEALMRSWEARKGELSRRSAELTQQMGAMGYGHYMLPQIQQEVGRIQGLSKEAENNFDSVAASTFQMREVFEGYRQSSDLAGKRRVKEATNAALQGLPPWPQAF